MSIRAVFLAIILVFCGFVLEHLELPKMLSWLQVPWILLVVSALVLTVPHAFGIILALIVGILLDVEYGHPFGLHALMLVVQVVLLRLNYRRFRIHGWLMVLTAVPLFVCISSLLANMVLWLVGSTLSLPVWQPVISSLLIWPIFYALYQFSVIRMRL